MGGLDAAVTAAGRGADARGRARARLPPDGQGRRLGRRRRRGARAHGHRRHRDVPAWRRPCGLLRPGIARDGRPRRLALRHAQRSQAHRGGLPPWGAEARGGTPGGRSGHRRGLRLRGMRPEALQSAGRRPPGADAPARRLARSLDDAAAGPGGGGVARTPSRQRRRARARERVRLHRCHAPLSRDAVARFDGMAGRPARSPCRPRDRAAARAPGPVVERGGTRAAGRAFALGPARALRRAHRPGADAVPRQLAHAAGRGTAAPGEHEGRHRGPGGRLRLGGGILAGVQAPDGAAARRMAPGPVSPPGRARARLSDRLDRAQADGRAVPPRRRGPVGARVSKRCRSPNPPGTRARARARWAARAAPRCRTRR